MSLLKRIFTIFQAESHTIVEKFEDPVKVTEQGIRDLRKHLSEALNALAEVKASMLRFQREAEKEKRRQQEYMRKAEALLKKAVAGEVAKEEAETLAAELVTKAEMAEQRVAELEQEAERQQELALKIQGKVNELKLQIAKYESELRSLKARAATAKAVKKVNKHLAKVDPSDTLAMLERMKEKVEREEALADAYGEIAEMEKDAEAKADALLAKTPLTTSAKFEQLKQKVGLV
jgi:phage shock protein A